MAATQLQAVAAGSGTSSVSQVTAGITASSGGTTLLVLATSISTTFATTPVTDSQGNTYTQIYSIASTTATVNRSIAYYLPNAPSGISSVTVAKSAGDTNGLSLFVIELSGVSASPLDVSHTNVASATGTALTSGTTASATNGDAIIGFGAADSSQTFSSPAFGGTATFTGQTNNGTRSDGSNVVSCMSYFGTLSGAGTAAFSVTASVAKGWTCGVITFLAGNASNVTATDTLGALSDTATRAAQAFTRSLSESLGALSDVPSRIVAFARSCADTLSAFVETATGGLVRSRTATDTLHAITDTATRSVTLMRTVSDALSAFMETVRGVGSTIASLITQNAAISQPGWAILPQGSQQWLVSYQLPATASTVSFGFAFPGVTPTTWLTTSATTSGGLTTATLTIGPGQAFLPTLHTYWAWVRVGSGTPYPFASFTGS